MSNKEKKDWTPEPFPEPRTIPEGWNADAIVENGSTDNDKSDDTEWKPDPFPEPRSFPWGSGR